MNLNTSISVKPLTVLFMLCSSVVYGQSKVPFNKAEATQEAITQLAQMASETGELTAFSIKNGIKGEYVVDITMEGKGDVLTVFMVSSSTDDILRKNLLKDKLHTLRFENIKIPKKERVKFRYTLTF